MRCLTCNYRLANLTEHRCPECGRAFDPNDRNSFGPRTRSFFRHPIVFYPLQFLLVVVTTWFCIFLLFVATMLWNHLDEPRVSFLFELANMAAVVTPYALIGVYPTFLILMYVRSSRD